MADIWQMADILWILFYTEMRAKGRIWDIGRDMGRNIGRLMLFGILSCKMESVAVAATKDVLMDKQNRS